MAIAAADVKKLRDATGAGMMDAKKALTEADGDFDQAIEALRISGAAKAAKRGAEREASAGLVARAHVGGLCSPRRGAVVGAASRRAGGGRANGAAGGRAGGGPAAG